MKKEVLIAIIIGFGLGLVITFGIWTANRALKSAAPQQEGSTEEAAVTTPAPAFSLTVVEPEENSISTEEEITVSGATTPQAVVVILYQEGEKILEADQKGQFSTQIELAGGANEIKISAHDNQGNEVEKTITVVYSTAKI